MSKECIDKNEMKIDNAIFDFVFEMAFRDAVMRNAFINPYKEHNDADEEFSKLKQNIKKITNGIVKDYLAMIISDGEIVNTLDYINKVVEKVNNSSIKNVNCFTFGNAQKLINMSAKYMFISCYNNPDFRDNFNECHCPMDGIIIKQVKKCVDSMLSDGKEKVEDLLIKWDCPKDKRRCWKGFLDESWSKIESNDISQYIFFSKYRFMDMRKS